MNLIQKNSIFEFNSDTLKFLREQYQLDKPGRIEEAVNILDDWIQKQPYFTKKNFERDYLERTIIICKGSVERAKVKIDKICTYRTIHPTFFEAFDLTKCKILKDIHGVFLPKLTNDHYRVYAFKSTAQNINNGIYEYYRYFFMQCEYLQAYDYCNGLIVLIDLRDANIMEIIKAVNINELQQTMTIMREGYGIRIKRMHFITESKTIETLIAIFKQIVSAKIAARLMVHKNIDAIYEHVPKDILPEEFGGNEKSIEKLHENFVQILSSKDFTDYLAEMKQACIHEKLKSNNAHDEHLGIPGSFRTLSVD